MPSSRNPVELGLEPRTTGKGRSEMTEATPGSVWMTRKGSPKVPGTCLISGPRSVTRETSSRRSSPITTISYGS